MNDFLSDYMKKEKDKYLSMLANAKTEAELESIAMSIPEPFRMEVLMAFMDGLTGGGSMYPPFEINPYRSIDSMLSDLRSHGNVGKKWAAGEWGQAGDLGYYHEKGDLLKDWLRLLKMLKTLESEVYRTTYSIRLITDLSGDHISNSSYLLEVSGPSIVLHTNNYYYGEMGFGIKVKVETESNKKVVLKQLIEDIESMVQNLTHQYFSWNQSNYDCPSSELEQIYHECCEVANKS